jgi:biotin operon repressor
MNHFKDTVKVEAVFKLLKLLFEAKISYTRKDLGARLDLSDDTIGKYLTNLENLGFAIDRDKRGRYKLITDKSTNHIEELLYFTKSDQNYIQNLLLKEVSSGKQHDRILSKMKNIFDYSRISNDLITNQMVEKIAILEEAIELKKVVKLIAYASSNSEKISDRLIEPYFISPQDDIVHSYEVDTNQIRHFKLSRIKKIEFTDLPWNNDHAKPILATDPFGITCAKTVPIKIILTVGGANEISYRFPKTTGFIIEDVLHNDRKILTCNVNDEFLGITNFILGNYKMVIEILESDAFIDHVNLEASKINF